MLDVVGRVPLIMLARYVPGGRVAMTEGVATLVWATFFALLGYAGGASYEDHPALGLQMAFAIGIGLALLVEVGRRIVTRGRGRVVERGREKLPAAAETCSAA
jgi:membrane-associated protein